MSEQCLARKPITKSSKRTFHHSKFIYTFKLFFLRNCKTASKVCLSETSVLLSPCREWLELIFCWGTEVKFAAIMPDWLPKIYSDMSSVRGIGSFRP